MDEAEIRQYFDACANLYGIVPVQQIYKILQAQNEHAPTKEHLRSFLLQNSRNPGTYAVVDPSNGDEKPSFLDLDVIYESVYKTGEAYYFILSSDQEGKPFYVPKKSELLRYADWRYYEMNQPIRALKLFLSDFEHDAAKIESVLLDVISDIQMSTHLSFGVNEEAEKIMRDIKIPSSSEEGMMKSLTHVQNHTRLWANRGFTPAELNEKKPSRIL